MGRTHFLINHGEVVIGAVLERHLCDLYEKFEKTSKTTVTGYERDVCMITG